MTTVTEKIKEILNTKLPLNPCIIYDIDDTIIDSETFDVNIDVLESYNYAKSKNIKIFIVTARPDTQQTVNYTYIQLENIGIKDTKIFFMPLNETNIAFYKHNVRKYLNDIGYSILVSIGDKYWDIGTYSLNNILIYKKNFIII